MQNTHARFLSSNRKEKPQMSIKWLPLYSNQIFSKKEIYTLFLFSKSSAICRTMYSFLRVCHALFNGRHTWQVFYMHTDTNVRMYTPLFTETQNDICGKITQQMILLTDLHTLYELCPKMQIQSNPKPLIIISSLLNEISIQMASALNCHIRFCQNWLHFWEPFLQWLLTSWWRFAW